MPKVNEEEYLLAYHQQSNEHDSKGSVAATAASVLATPYCFTKTHFIIKIITNLINMLSDSQFESSISFLKSYRDALACVEEIAERQ